MKRRETKGNSKWSIFTEKDDYWQNTLEISAGILLFNIFINYLENVK